MLFDIEKIDPALTKVFVDSGSLDESVAIAAQKQFAVALKLPLRQGVFPGNIIDGIFEVSNIGANVSAEMPLDFVSPGTERDFTAYTIPNHGRIPEKAIEGDYVQVPTYEIGNSIDWLLKYARDARWDIVGRAMQAMEAGVVKKMNDDGWHTIIMAAADRNIMVFDSDANQGQFTKRFVNVFQTVMRRNGGGNSTSLNHGRLTDLYLSPEGAQDPKSWGIDQLDDTSRRELYLTGEDGVSSIYGVRLHPIDEFGEDQEYNNFFTQVLGGSPASGDVEICVGLDLRSNDSFWMPVKAPFEVYSDPTMHRSRRAGFYGWTELGFAVLDNRRCLLGSF
jgi:hypothetical protein